MFAHRQGATQVDVLASEGAATCAMRASLLDPPSTVWAVDGTDVQRAVPVEVSPADAPSELVPELRGLLDRPNVRIVDEFGVLTAECRGVEVARVSGTGADQRIDVGVGAYDQGAYATMNPGRSPGDSLDDVVSQVLQHRQRGAEPHPLNRLVRERWLREELVQHPERLGLTRVVPVAGHRARDGLRDVVPAFAVGDDDVLIACSVGIDLDLVPAAAEVAARESLDEIVFVLPARDRHRATTDLAQRLRCRHRFVDADEPWAAPA